MQTEKRRGPGRPPSRPPIPTISKNGIMEIPKDPNNKLEFIYDDPQIFKSLFTYFKNIKAQEIHIKCSPKGLTFYTRDHSKMSRIFAIINGQYVNWFYCKEEYWIGMNRENVEKIFASIDKTFSSIVLVQEIEEQLSINIIFKDLSIDKECNYRITLSSYRYDNELYLAEKILENPSSQLDFVLSAKHFKKTINDASNYTNIINIERMNPDATLHQHYPLKFTYVNTNISYDEIYKKDSSIKLNSNIPHGNTFRCVIDVNNIRSLSNSMVTDEIRIVCKNDEDILFISEIDSKALIVYTLMNTGKKFE